MYNKKDERVLKAYLDDYRKSLHVREIAKLIKISPSAASYMTRSLERQRILNHKMEGRNKKFFINSANPAAKDMIVSAEIEKKKEIMEKHFIIKKALLEVDFEGCMAVIFGSFAKGLENESSDIDLLLIGNRKIRKKLENFARMYKKQLHIIEMGKDDFISEEKREFIKEIIGSHVVLSGTEEFVGMIWRIYYAS